MMNLDKILELVTEDVYDDDHNTADLAHTAVTEIEKARLRIKKLQLYLQSLNDRMCAELALKIRRKQPRLNISINKDGCKIAYKTKLLLLKPDMNKNIWQIKSNVTSFARSFLANYASKTRISNDNSGLVDAIVAYFADSFKSINEEISDSGLIMIDGQFVTILKLGELVTKMRDAQHDQQ